VNRRRRTVIVRTTEGGEVLETVRIVNDVERLASVMARARAPDIGDLVAGVCSVDSHDPHAGKS
jgi:hypothetical protein